MVFRCPSGLLALQKMQQLPALHFLAGGLQQKSAAAARAYQSVDFPQKVTGNQNVRSLCAFHMCILSVPLRAGIVKAFRD